MAIQPWQFWPFQGLSYMTETTGETNISRLESPGGPVNPKTPWDFPNWHFRVLSAVGHISGEWMIPPCPVCLGCLWMPGASWSTGTDARWGGGPNCSEVVLLWPETKATVWNVHQMSIRYILYETETHYTWNWMLERQWFLFEMVPEVHVPFWSCSIPCFRSLHVHQPRKNFKQCVS